MDLNRDTNITVSFDDKYIYPFLLLAFSIQKNSTKKPKIFIANVNSTLSKDSQNIIAIFSRLDRREFRVVEVSIPKNVKTSSRVSIAGYRRLWLAYNLSEDFVYIDTDSLVLPGSETIFDYLELIEENQELLLAAMPALENKTPPWPIPKEDKTQYRFHSGILVIKNENWKKHFSTPGNLPWQKIATMHDELKFVGHDQPVLQYAAQGKYLHLPDDFVNLATKFTETAKVVTSGVWLKPWTVPREQYFKYISSLMMYQNYKEVFGVVKELEIYSRYEDEMLDYLSLDENLKQEILENKLRFQTVFKIRHNIPFLANKILFEIIGLPRKLISIIK